DLSPRHIEGEASSPVPDVQSHTAADRGAYFGQYTAARIQNAALVSVKGVGNDVPLGHYRKNVAELRAGVADVHHQRKFDGFGCLLGQPEGGKIMFTGNLPREPDFDSQDHVPVLLYGSDREFGVGIAQIEQLAVRVVVRQRRLTDHRNIQQRVNPRVDNVDQLFTEAGECVRSSRAGIEYGGNSLRDAVRVGRNAQRRHTVVNVDMNIDQPRSHDLAAGVQHMARLRLLNPCGNPGDLPARNGDIQLAGKLLGRIYHAPSLDHQIVARRGLGLSCKQITPGFRQAAHQPGSDGCLVQEFSPCNMVHDDSLLRIFVVV